MHLKKTLLITILLKTKLYLAVKLHLNCYNLSNDKNKRSKFLILDIKIGSRKMSTKNLSVIESPTTDTF